MFYWFSSYAKCYHVLNDERLIVGGYPSVAALLRDYPKARPAAETQSIMPC